MSLSKINDLLSIRDYLSVTKEKDLFWLLFCKLASEKCKPKCAVTFYQECDSITVRDDKYQTKEHIEAFVEAIRLVIMDNLEKKNNIKIVIKRYGIKTLWKNRYNDDGKLAQLLSSEYKEYIRPLLSDLFDSVGIDLKFGLVHNDCDKPHKKIQYIDGVFRDVCIYTIPPRIIQREGIDLDLYKLYQSGFDCNFSIITLESDEIRVNTSILYTRGGEIIRDSIRQANTFILPYSSNTVRAFIDFIYLGEAGINHHDVLLKKISLYELITLGYDVAMNDLIHHCTNLYSLVATVDYIDEIERLANSYNDAYLRLLYTALVKIKYIY